MLLQMSTQLLRRNLCTLSIHSPRLPLTLTHHIRSPNPLHNARFFFKPSSVIIKATSSSSPQSQAPPPPSSFSDLGLSNEILDALKEKGLSQPTEIQSSAIPPLLDNRTTDFILASHTGSGKTLAYLLPVIHILKEEETQNGMPCKPKRPRVLVLGPTRELTEQIYGVSKSLSHVARFRTAIVTASADMSSQKSLLDKPLDILIGTPARITAHAQRGNVYYGDVQVVVVDEADTMLDRGFGIEVEEILKAVRSKPNPARCILVSATMTKAIRRLIQDTFPSIQSIETSTLHRGVAGARHSFLPVTPGSNKLDIAMQVVEGAVARGQRAMIFCNTLDSCRAVEHSLREAGLATVCYHGDVPLEERRNALKEFSDPERDPPPLLVATDLAARGLDIPGKVDHVINFDFPLNPVDYLHRTGRTARAGASGRITSLVGKSDRVLAERIEEGLAKGLALDALSANKAVLPPHMRPKPETLRRRALEKKASKHESRGKRGAARKDSGRSGPSPGGQRSGGGGGGGKKRFAKFK